VSSRVTVALALLLLATLLPSPGVPLASATGGTTAPSFLHYYGPPERTYFPDEAPVFVQAGEPSIGVNRITGKAFFQHGFTTFRVAFDDAALTASWADVSPAVSEFNVDPILVTDEATGRTYAGGLDGACSVMAYTDDDGATWTPTGNACVATLDHESIASGPWRSPRPAAAIHDRAVYYCAQASAVTCVTSLDGGLTFSQPSAVTCASQTPGFHGSIHVGPQGNVFLPFRNCGGKIGLAVSLNNGLTWAAHQVPGSVTPSGGFDPDVATTPSGRLYIGYRNGTGGANVAVSNDNGTTWTRGVDVGASLGLVSTTFQEMVAGDDDRAALAFLGTTTPGNPFAAGFTGVWHLYVATTYDGGATWTTRQVTDDPVQRGWICAGGTGCTSGRNLLDFMDAQVDAQGRVLVGYVDGCVDACAGPSGTPAQSTGQAPVITRQVAGTTLFAAYDGVYDGLRAAAGGSVSGVTGAATPLLGRALGGAGPYAYAWSVDAAPSGSAAGASSFSSATSAATSFTPDVAGAYVLRLTVTDAASATATDTATFTATTSAALPPLVDPDGDALLPGTDIRSADVVGETATTFDVVLRVDDLDAALPSTASVAGIPLGVDTVYSVGWVHAESATNAVRYQVSASHYALTLPGDPAFSYTLSVVGVGATNYLSEVANVPGSWDPATGTITWTVAKASMVVKKAPTGPSDAGVMTGGRVPSAGDTFGGFDATATSWFYAGVGLGPGATRWDVATGTGSRTLSQ
jgi:hypothetical protein